MSMMQTDFSPIWPETTVFWGAGATAQLGFPATAEHGKLLRQWGRTKNWDKIKDELPKEKWPDESIEHLRQLLIVLGFGEKRVRIAQVTDEVKEILRDRFPDWDNEEQIDFVANLRTDYDWDALQAIINMLPKQCEDNQLIQDIYNVLDMHIVSGLSFNVGAHKTSEEDEREELETLTLTRLIGARNCLTMLVTLMLQAAYRALITNSPEKLYPYKEMASALASLMKKEGLRFLRDGHDVAAREAYLFSYAIVSLNFEPMLLWLLFNAHKDANDSCSYVTSECQKSLLQNLLCRVLESTWYLYFTGLIINPNEVLLAFQRVLQESQKIKLYHDMAHFVGSRNTSTDDLVPWYPFNEAAVQRVNDSDHPSDRIARVGKFYFMHGCMCWRECPSCGKLIMALGDEWKVESPTLFPPLPLQPQDRFLCKARSKQESTKRKQGHLDAIQCVYCGAMTHTYNTPLIMQTSYKGRHSSFLEEIARDMRACLEKTKHIVLLGYSLPQDDVIYRSLLSSRRAKDVKCSVVVGYLGGNRWLDSSELDSYCQKYKRDKDAVHWGVPTIEAAQEIFGKEHVRAYTGGIPQVFECEGSIEASLKKILYPTDFEIGCFTANGVQRSFPS